jgi:hypothetical protein
VITARSLPSYTPLPPLSQACDVILTFSAHFGESPQRPRPRGPKRARLKEKASLTNFLFYGFFIKGLGAELLAPEDRRKFGKNKRPLDFWLPRGSRYSTGKRVRP